MQCIDRFASRIDGSRRIEEIGLMLYVQVPGRGMISLTEPWSIFDFTLRE